jgi:hypothetical protein
VLSTLFTSSEQLHVSAVEHVFNTTIDRAANFMLKNIEEPSTFKLLGDTVMEIGEL